MGKELVFTRKVFIFFLFNFFSTSVLQCPPHLPTDSSLMFCKENLWEKSLFPPEMCLVFLLKFFSKSVLQCPPHLPTDSSLMFCKENIWKKRLLSSVLTAGNHLSIYTPHPALIKKQRKNCSHHRVFKVYTKKQNLNVSKLEIK
jgi:hypothetical protein